jgi:P4 family phage/plasmid primase-like protien
MNGGHAGVLEPVSGGQTPMARRTRLQMQQLAEADTDCFGLAREFVNTEGRDRHGHITIRCWRGEWYRHQDGRFVIVSDGAMRVVLTGFIKSYIDEKRLTDVLGYALRVSKSLVANTLNALSAIVAVADDIEMPAWLGDEGNGPFLATKNGLLDLSEPSAPTPRVIENSPQWFSTVALPVNYDPAAKCDGWMVFLGEVMEGDADRIELIQELAGYLLTVDTTQHKFVVAEGEGANGKSVLLDVLTALLGPENVAHVPLEMFGNRFQLTPTVGKLANVCAEVGEIDRVAEGFLKQFTAGDRMYFDRKNMSGVMAYPSARLILSTNNRPQFRDRSAGLWRRMIVLPFRVTIPVERQDPLLKEKLKSELPGILNWALRGRVRLEERGHFNIPAICAEALEEYKQESNPARVFLTENCAAEASASTSCSHLYAEYVIWSKENGFPSLDSRQFGKEARKVFPTLARAKANSFGGRRWVYRGLAYLPSRLGSAPETRQEN